MPACLLPYKLRLPPSERIWRLSRYWVFEESIEADMAKSINYFWISNADSSMLHTRWDAFKAYIWGCYQTSISLARHNARVFIEDTEARAQALEFQYVQTQNPIALLDMQAAHREVMLLRVAGAKKHQLTDTVHF